MVAHNPNKIQKDTFQVAPVVDQSTYAPIVSDTRDGLHSEENLSIADDDGGEDNENE